MEQARRLMVSMNKTSDPACKAKLRSEAVASFQRGLSVTPEVEKHAIAAMRRLGVTVIVAPYEADSQLAYLCAIGMCEAVLTEDSDIIVYSAICKTNFPILYKFSTNGIAQMIECSRVFRPHRPPLNPDGTESTGRRSKFLASLRDYLGPSGRRMFVQMCVLAGCDYNDSVPGVGLQYAQQVSLFAVLCRVFSDWHMLFSLLGRCKVQRCGRRRSAAEHRGVLAGKRQARPQRVPGARQACRIAVLLPPGL